MARILALEPYYGGSHQAFLDGWMSHSRHQFELHPLKPHHWKWRMRHAAVTLAQQVTAHNPQTFDLLWCSSMCNVAELLGLCPPWLRSLPVVAYFHENQLVYPSQNTDPRDVHFAFTNWTTACAASEVWFNSAFNRDSLLTGLDAVFHKLPDHREAFQPTPLRAKSKVLAPGIDFVAPPRHPRNPAKPLHLIWAARFEHDKGPEVLLAALRIIAGLGLRFEVTIMGQQFAGCPHEFAQLQTEFAPHIQHFGYEPNKQRYVERLANADLFISTAHHEFFGLSVLEAAYAGCSLALPNRLSYPEVFASPNVDPAGLFYDGTAQGLAALVKRIEETPPGLRPTYREIAERYAWQQRAALLDDAVDSLVNGAT